MPNFFKRGEADLDVAAGASLSVARYLSTSLGYANNTMVQAGPGSDTLVAGSDLIITANGIEVVNNGVYQVMVRVDAPMTTAPYLWQIWPAIGINYGISVRRVVPAGPDGSIETVEISTSFIANAVAGDWFKPTSKHMRGVDMTGIYAWLHVVRVG